MHIIQNTIWIPKIVQKELDDNISSFKIWPLPKWFWVTLANPLRRVLLSSIPWTKVTGIKVKGVSHEYSTLPWIKDSILDIILNLKWLMISQVDNWETWLKLSKNKLGKVTASDIKAPSGIEILNPDLYITEIDQNGLELDIDIRIEKNVWYLSVEDMKSNEDDPEVLLIDANFSPVLNVKYNIEQVRFWKMTNLDSLELIIQTNWAITPFNAIKFSWDMLKSYNSLFNNEELQVEGHFVSDINKLIEQEKEVEEEIEVDDTYTPIEVMWLSPRTLNALINWNILSIEQLIKCTETKLWWIKWFGKKAMKEIRVWLDERNLKLLWDD